jgi:hypothetical protein
MVMVPRPVFCRMLSILTMGIDGEEVELWRVGNLDFLVKEWTTTKNTFTGMPT